MGFREIWVKAKDSMVPGNPSAHEIAEGIHHSHMLTMFPFNSGCSSWIFLSWSVYLKKRISADAWEKKLTPYYNLSLNKYFFDENYDKYLYQPLLRLADRISFIDWDLYESTSSMVLAM
ncbi:MAG: hypothetical protein CM1200mP10_15300 [Candidatus Neomarinimicrobiota bacterium]|nr:MAG: hypothetical protein CM1200mP10_15300 [Candidatus Neomarinimicrobiota bacterium]